VAKATYSNVRRTTGKRRSTAGKTRGSFPLRRSSCLKTKHFLLCFAKSLVPLTQIDVQHFFALRCRRRRSSWSIAR
jgi:hypothetical protein